MSEGGTDNPSVDFSDEEIDGGSVPCSGSTSREASVPLNQRYETTIDQLDRLTSQSPSNDAIAGLATVPRSNMVLRMDEGAGPLNLSPRSNMSPRDTFRGDPAQPQPQGVTGLSNIVLESNVDEYSRLLDQSGPPMAARVANTPSVPQFNSQQGKMSTANTRPVRDPRLLALARMSSADGSSSSSSSWKAKRGISFVKAAASTKRRLANTTSSSIIHKFVFESSKLSCKWAASQEIPVRNDFANDDDGTAPVRTKRGQERQLTKDDSDSNDEVDEEERDSEGDEEDRSNNEDQEGHVKTNEPAIQTSNKAAFPKFGGKRGFRPGARKFPPPPKPKPAPPAHEGPSQSPSTTGSFAFGASSTEASKTITTESFASKIAGADTFVADLLAYSNTEMVPETQIALYSKKVQARLGLGLLPGTDQLSPHELTNMLISLIYKNSGEVYTVGDAQDDITSAALGNVVYMLKKVKNMGDPRVYKFLMGLCYGRPRKIKYGRETPSCPEPYIEELDEFQRRILESTPLFAKGLDFVTCVDVVNGDTFQIVLTACGRRPDPNSSKGEPLMRFSPELEKAFSFLTTFLTPLGTLMMDNSGEGLTTSTGLQFQPMEIPNVESRGKLLGVLCGANHTIVFYEMDPVGCGLNGFGQLGVKPDDSSKTLDRICGSGEPKFVFPKFDFTFAKGCGGESHSAVLDTKHNVHIFGDNRYGQFGQPISDNQSMPRPFSHIPQMVPGLPPVLDISAASHHTLVITDETKDNLFFWGESILQDYLQSTRFRPAEGNVVPDAQKRIPFRAHLNGRKVLQASCGAFHFGMIVEPVEGKKVEAAPRLNFSKPVDFGKPISMNGVQFSFTGLNNLSKPTNATATEAPRTTLTTSDLASAFSNPTIPKPASADKHETAEMNNSTEEGFVPAPASAILSNTSQANDTDRTERPRFTHKNEEVSNPNASNDSNKDETLFDLKQVDQTTLVQLPKENVAATESLIPTSTTSDSASAFSNLLPCIPKPIDVDPTTAKSTSINDQDKVEITPSTDAFALSPASIKLLNTKEAKDVNDTKVSDNNTAADVVGTETSESSGESKDQTSSASHIKEESGMVLTVPDVPNVSNSVEQQSHQESTSTTQTQTQTQTQSSLVAGPPSTTKQSLKDKFNNSKFGVLFNSTWQKLKGASQNYKINEIKQTKHKEREFEKNYEKSNARVTGVNNNKVHDHVKSRFSKFTKIMTLSKVGLAVPKVGVDEKEMSNVCDEDVPGDNGWKKGWRKVKSWFRCRPCGSSGIDG
ncbi:hypothetical protein HDU76_002476 [Blyttiomyces sp. JEL0837]|nr:hypothetical protein HDU76_002476 [Blyttiomyces sp. JEL0837]